MLGRRGCWRWCSATCIHHHDQPVIPARRDRHIPPSPLLVRCVPQAPHGPQSGGLHYLSVCVTSHVVGSVVPSGPSTHLQRGGVGACDLHAHPQEAIRCHGQAGNGCTAANPALAATHQLLHLQFHAPIRQQAHHAAIAIADTDLPRQYAQSAPLAPAAYGERISPATRRDIHIPRRLVTPPVRASSRLVLAAALIVGWPRLPLTAYWLALLHRCGIAATHIRQAQPLLTLRVKLSAASVVVVTSRSSKLVTIGIFVTLLFRKPRRPIAPAVWSNSSAVARRDELPPVGSGALVAQARPDSAWGWHR